MTEYVSPPAWRNLLAEIWDANHNLSGAVAVLSLVSQQMKQANELRHSVGADYFLKRGLGDWDARFAALLSRLAFYAGELELVAKGEVDNPIEHMLAWVIDPILDGVFLKDKKQIKMTFGDAVESATLWNQAATAKATRESLALDTWLPASIMDWFSQVNHDLELSAPGEAPTAADAVKETVDAVKEKTLDVAKKVVEGAGTLLLVAALGFGGVLAIALLRKTR